jgi:uncharacterized phosphosugar-binding protein
MATLEFLKGLIALIETLDTTQDSALRAAAARCADAVESDGLIHLFGSGHSVIPVLEAFPRYGAFAALNPLTDPRLMWWNVLGPGGVRELLWLERTEGYVAQFLNSQPIAPPDVVILISHGGRTAAPIEAAIFAREKGAYTVAVTSILNRQRSSEHSSGKHLSDLVDLVIDTGVPVEDALVYLDGEARPVGGASTLVAAAAVNQLMVLAATELHRRGALPPVFVSPTVPGASVSSNDEAFDAYRRRIQAARARGE